jgi:hypothetical protein
MSVKLAFGLGAVSSLLILSGAAAAGALSFLRKSL